MRTGARILHFLASATTVGVVGCKHIPPTPQTAEPTDPARGHVAFTFFADPKVGPPKVSDHQELVAPDALGKLVAPAYPAAPPAAHADPATVALRIVIGEDGHVLDVLDSPLMQSTPSPFAADFRAAAETAVRRWRFTPGRIDQYEDGPDVNGDGVPDSTRLIRSDNVQIFYDVRFDFEIVGGQGRVKSSATP